MRRELLIHNEVFFAEILSRVAEGKRPPSPSSWLEYAPLHRGGQDQIVLSPLTEDSYQVGRVVLARIARGYLVHRIVRIDGGVFTLRGDGQSLPA